MTTVHNLKPVAQPKRRVMVVDDNLDTVHTTAMLIRSMGHEVQFAINGFAALEVAREFRPDVILLDITLPDFNGVDIARQLRYEPGLEKTRIIAVTGRRLDEVRERAIGAGCEEVLAKPLAISKLEELLAK
jgi:CheY-like chemotaxis protein